EGRIFAALSIGVVTSPDIIEPGLLIKFPDFDHYGAFFARLEHPVVHGVAEGFVNFVADPQTPLRIAAAEGNRAFVAAKEDGGTRMLVGSATIGSDSVLTEIWAHLLETDGAFPAGLHVEPDGRLLVISSDGMMYTFSDSGDVFEADRRLAASLSGDRALPVGDVVIGSGAGPGGNDQLFLVVNGRVEHQVLGRTRLAGGHIAGATHYDLGIGLENGYSLNPLGLAWSASTQRLAIIDAFARVQLLNVQPASGDPATYVTKWGDYGEFPGQFVVIPATAVSVSTDDMGRIYVADSSFRIQVFSP
ncbi:MAG: hypothetical protein HOH74_00820, partial [Gemmatimonadetes bacterium]|nr:hypothetical protein [Gemmatimonadota bacterium]